MRRTHIRLPSATLPDLLVTVGRWLGHIWQVDRTSVPTKWAAVGPGRVCRVSNHTATFLLEHYIYFDYDYKHVLAQPTATCFST